MDFYYLDKTDSKYPDLLREISDAPSRIYVRGELPNSTLPLVGIVGTRKATKYSKELANETAKKLARAGVAVVSGLAMGIDTEAHKGALEGGGITIAVLGNGIDSIYPAQNEKLAKRILDEGGAIISEYGPDEPSYRGRFIERNRIISGLSLAVVVVEAPERSGAISTARFAAEQGRSVFVFPSTPSNRAYRGSHELIRDGATLVADVDEILEDIGAEAAHKSEEKMKKLGGDEYKIVSVLTDAGKPLKVDMILELTTLEPQVASNILTTLVLEGIIRETDNGYEISSS